MSVIYKTLFEVRLLHEYYLINSKGESYFALANDQKREELLLEKVTDDFYRLQTDWEITVVEGSEALTSGYHLRLLPGTTGFRVVVEVKRVVLPDGTINYFPAITPSEDQTIYFSIRPRNSAGSELANFPFQSSLRSIFYFDNDNSGNDKVFPSLSRPIAAFDQTRIYEQGELALFPTNEIFEFINKKNANPNDQWRKVAGSGFVTSADRFLLPFVFTYQFPGGLNITDCYVSLATINGDPVKAFAFSQTTPMKSVALNFIKDENDEEVPPGLYTLQVAGSNNFNDTKTILLNNNIYRQDRLAVIGIKVGKSGNNFALLGNDGSLKTHVLPDGTKVIHPIYELRYKSRIVYFRYSSKENKKLKPPPEILQFHMDDVDGKLISKEPRSFSYSPYPFKRSGSNTTDYLPQPDTTTITVGEERRLFSDILVPFAGIFSKGP